MSEKTQETAQVDLVRNKKAFSFWIAKHEYAALYYSFREDVEQEIQLLLLENTQQEVGDVGFLEDIPEEFTLNEWARMTRNALTKLAAGLGFKWGSKLYHAQMTVTDLLQERDDDRQAWLEDVLFATEWSEEKQDLVAMYEFCQEVIRNSGSETAESDWALFLLWMHGYSRQEISIVTDLPNYWAMESALIELATRVREAAEVDLDFPLPMPSFTTAENVVEASRLIQKARKGEEELDIGAGGGVRIEYPYEMEDAEVERRFWISRKTRWLGKKRGSFIVGCHVPKKGSPLRADPTNICDVDSTLGKKDAKLQILGRDGWWVNQEGMWTYCQLCGEPLLVSDTTIEHIMPRSKGGSNRLGNLCVAHEVCNAKKADRLPSFYALAELFPERFEEFDIPNLGGELFEL